MDGVSRSLCPPSALRRFLTSLALGICLLLLVHAFFLETFQIPTGSMAPTLLGHHRSGVCPRCGFVVKVGRPHAAAAGVGGERHYARSWCPNCGSGSLELGKEPETRGDQVLVSTSLYALRRPRRWEIVVLRMFGKTFIKRLIGLGGEEIELVDGDIYVNGKLARKTLDEFLGMRVLLFDNAFAPKPEGWHERWEYEPAYPAAQTRPLILDGRASVQKLTYRNFSLDERKCEPLLDEHAYNGPTRGSAEAVHDFMVEAEVEVVAGTGTFGVTLMDGALEAEVIIGTGQAGVVVVQTRGCESEEPALVVGARSMQLHTGKRYYIEAALVDRRLTLRVDGQDAFPPLDLPEPGERAPVIRPVRFTAQGVLARLHEVRLYRDLHYTQAGRNAVRGRAARLGIDQTFVLGDNSSNSDDSRFWPSQGAVPLENLLGRAFLVHLPSRTIGWRGSGRQWQLQLPDWERVHWLR